MHLNIFTKSTTSWKLNSKAVDTIKRNTIFVQSISTKYDWSPSVKTKISRDLEFIKAKQNDNNLNLSIIGEFSSGKSSFINALLRDELLEIDVLQGTTVASALIRYSEKHDLLLNTKSGTKTSIRDTKFNSRMSIEQFRSCISEYTTNDKLARELESFEILLPAETLRKKIVIIDTPGTNSLERWHEEVTSSTIRELSDASIILISADKPISNTLIEFVNQNLTDVLSRCIFVVTKMDLISAKEQFRQIDYIKKRVTTAFGVENPFVLPYSSIVILTSVSHSKIDTNCWIKDLLERDPILYDQLLRDSTKTEEIVIKFLEGNRISIQLHKLTEMVESLFTDIQNNMRQLQTHYKERRSALERAAIPDLEAFIQKQVQKHRQTYILECAIKKQQILNKFCEDAADIYNSKVKPTIFGFQTKQDLENFMKGFQSKLQYEFNSVFSMNMAECAYFNILATRQLNEFNTEFKKLYENLAILDQSYAWHNNSAGGNHNHNSASISYNTKNIIQSIEDSKGAMGGMGFVGAAIGTVVLPVVGTIIGGAIGAVIGWFFEPSLEDMQNNCWSKLVESYPQVENEMSSFLTQEIDVQINHFTALITAKINSYYKEYGITVAKIMKNEIKVKQQYDININQLHDDLEQIEERKRELTLNKEAYGGISNGGENEKSH